MACIMNWIAPALCQIHICWGPCLQMATRMYWSSVWWREVRSRWGLNLMVMLLRTERNLWHSTCAHKAKRGHSGQLLSHRWVTKMSPETVFCDSTLSLASDLPFTGSCLANLVLCVGSPSRRSYLLLAFTFPFTFLFLRLGVAFCDG